MAWYTTAIFYELYLRAFADGNNDGHGDFIGLRDKLDSDSNGFCGMVVPATKRPYFEPSRAKKHELRPILSDYLP